MAATPRKLFVNLAVKDVERTTRFFSALGFTFNAHFSSATAACMVLSDEAFVMLLAEPYFRTFTHRKLADTTLQTEALLAISCATREEVDTLVDQALASGGSDAMPASDHGFMYVRSFYDLDGHHWEVMWMDPAAVPQS